MGKNTLLIAVYHAKLQVFGEQPKSRALLVAAGADLFNPWYFGEIINHVLINRDQAAFLQSIIILSVVSLLSGKLPGVKFHVSFRIVALIDFSYRYGCPWGSLLNNHC